LPNVAQDDGASSGQVGFIAALDQSGGSSPRPMVRLMHEMRVRIMIAPVDPLAADADLAAASWAGIHRLRSHGGFGRRWVRYGELTFRPRFTIGGAG
jgi:hypothetical protein